MANAIRVDAKPLASALSRVLPVVRSRVTAPILAMARLSVVGGQLKISGTDLDMQIDVTGFPVESSGDFSIAADPRQLGALLRHLQGEVVKLSVEDEKLSIVWSDGEAALNTLPASDFVDIVPGPAKATTSLPPTFVSDVLDRVSLCVSTDECRYYLSGACISKGPGGVASLVSTDGHRLCVLPCEALAAVSASRSIIRADTIRAWISAGRARPAGLTLHQSHVTIDLGDLSITSKLIDGKYPDYARVIPEATGEAISFSRSALQLALDRLSAAATHKSTNALGIEPGAGGVKLSMRDTLAGFSISQMTAASGALSEPIGFNIAYVLDVLKIARGQTITLTAKNAYEPVLVTGDEDVPGTVSVLMPLRLFDSKTARKAA